MSGKVKSEIARPDEIRGFVELVASADPSDISSKHEVGPIAAALRARLDKIGIDLGIRISRRDLKPLAELEK